MNAPETVSIIKRFFLALAELKGMQIIRGKKTFTDQYGIDRWNLNKLEKDPEKWPFHTEWIVYLVRDYGLSAKWLISGIGSMFDKTPKAGQIQRSGRIIRVNKKVNNDN